MKITKTRLKQIIKEELQNTLNEQGRLDYADLKLYFRGGQKYVDFCFPSQGGTNRRRAAQPDSSMCKNVAFTLNHRLESARREGFDTFGCLKKGGQGELANIQSIMRNPKKWLAMIPDDCRALVLKAVPELSVLEHAVDDGDIE
jgi:hypothetical protein